MQPKSLTIRQSLNKAFLKVKPSREGIEKFKTNLLHLLESIDPKESEEHLKNQVRDFLINTWYTDHYINTKGKNDLVIHLGKDAKSEVGVIIEAKKPSNYEMVRKENLNTKAFHELILYFLRERIKEKNRSLKHLIATNTFEWFIFDASVFDKLFAQNKQLVKQFMELEQGQYSDNRTEVFYKEIAKPFVENLTEEIPYAYFNIRSFEKPLRNAEKEDDKELIPLYKILSPEHLLQLPFQNDSNSLNKHFYADLLHIIGLAEVEDKKGGKKLIQRLPEGKRNRGSLLELAIEQLDALDKLNRIPNVSRHYGRSQQEQLFNVGLELCITWVNRILFLKLLEAQLLSYHKADKTYSFLNIDKVTDFDALNGLFFQVLAKRPEKRIPGVKERFDHVPYLNSSLFEPTELEQITLFVSMLPDNVALPVSSISDLKDNKGKQVKGELPGLEYLFRFLDAYDFSAESEEIQEEGKSLINASVLGLIFEKINGYKDGSFFTPSFVTMYMCRETLSRAVIEKFNQVKGWDCKNLIDLHNKLDYKEKKEANEIFNSIRVCDPAVGSGHFLVSALNELIAIKGELEILIDEDGRSLKGYSIEIANDELVITDEEDKPFLYNPASKESLRVQKTIFHEKQTLIENCLFGVDINPNSVKICQLRLWIELLKNAYYKQDTGQLETLPNIDINIKDGNSLISRFSLDAKLGKELKKSQFNIKRYKEAVSKYRHAQSKEEKREMNELIESIKGNYRSEIGKNDPTLRKLRKSEHEMYVKYSDDQLFDQKLTKQQLKDKKELQALIEKLSSIVDQIKNNKIYEGAFEWRFEFPEVLNDDGEFTGFDAVIGNPPYLPLEAFNEQERGYFRMRYPVFTRKYDASALFIYKGFEILKKGTGLISYITPVTWQTGENYCEFRKLLFSDKGIERVINLPFNVFDDAYVDTGIFIFLNKPTSHYYIYNFEKNTKEVDLASIDFLFVDNSIIDHYDFKLIQNSFVANISSRINSIDYAFLGDITKSTQGLSGSNFLVSDTDENDEFTFPFLSKGNVYNYSLVKEKTYSTSLKSKQNLISYYESEPKILIRRIINRQNRLSVCYCQEKLVFKKDINPFILTSTNFKTKYVLAILASRFISYLYLSKSTIANKDDFRQTTLSELRKLPIVIADSNIENQIICKVDEILSTKSLDPTADTSAVENEIDNLVYQLYHLTQEEISLIEEATS